MSLAGAPSVASPARLKLSAPLAVGLIALGFMLLGLVVRYAAYAATVEGASLAEFPMGLCRWDCAWYIRIAETGYDPFPVPSGTAAGNWAFFPLMPMLVGGLRWFVTLDTIMVATLVSLTLSWGSAVLAWPLLDRDWRSYMLFCAYMLAGPFSIYFTSFMTEPLFLLLSLGALGALKRRSYLEAGIWAGLASATRMVGAVLALALLVQATVDHRRAGGRWNAFLPALLKRPDIVLGLALAPLGLVAYMAFLNSWIGDGLAFLHVQRAWSRPDGSPLDFIWAGLTSFPTAGWVPTTSQQLGLAVVVAYGLMILLAVRGRWAELSFSLVALTAPLFAGLASMLRFIAASAPLPLLLCQLLGRNRTIFALALAGFVASGYFTSIFWIRGALALV